ncbi:MAG: hypothetical protein AAF628_37205 [Planctomycetota bacterium]
MSRLRLVMVCVAWLAAPGAAQFANPGAYVSGPPAGATAGKNLLFFGNSYTISSANPAVHTPSYGGARGLPELVRQVAMAAGQPAPFVKNVYHLNRGFDYHLNPQNPSLGHIDEPELQGETWDAVVLQGFSTRPTHHPYTGNARLHQENAWRLFEEVRDGSTGHVSKHAAVVPVLYQTWARQADHWFYDLSSPHTSGHNIAIGVAQWTGGPLFAGPEEMAAEVRTSYDEARRAIRVRTPGAAPVVAPAGDAWEAADWGRGFANLYAADHYHASSRGDLLTALTLYGAIFGETDTAAIVASGNLDPVLAAIGVMTVEAQQLAAWADQVLRQPPVAQPPQWPASAVLVDFSTQAGTPAGGETRPVPGRRYNTMADRVAGRIDDAVDTEGRTTGIEIAVVDAFAGETAAGAEGSFISAVNLSGSLYAPSAQVDSFFVGRGAGFADARARVEVRGLDPGARYDLVVHGSRASTSFSRIGRFTVQGEVQTLDAAHNLNLVAAFVDVAPDAAGTISLEVDNGGGETGFAYLGVLELRASARLFGLDRAPAPGTALDLRFEAPAHVGGLALTGVSTGLGPILYGPHLLRLAPDPLFVASFGSSGSAVFAGFAAALDARGVTQPALVTPAWPGLVGLELHVASLVADPGGPGGVAVVSNPWSFRFGR